MPWHLVRVPDTFVRYFRRGQGFISSVKVPTRRRMFSHFVIMCRRWCSRMRDGIPYSVSEFTCQRGDINCSRVPAGECTPMVQELTSYIFRSGLGLWKLSEIEVELAIQKAAFEVLKDCFWGLSFSKF